MRIELEFNELLIFIEAGINGSHLRWHIIERAIDEFYHVLSVSQWLHAYNYFKRITDKPSLMY